MQINGEDLSLKSDVFSLGSLLWEVATSKIPFSDTPMNDLDVIRATLNKPEPKMAPLGYACRPWIRKPLCLVLENAIKIKGDYSKGHSKRLVVCRKKRMKE